MLEMQVAAEKADAILEYCGTTDIWEILDKLEVLYSFDDYGSAGSGLKGYCTCFFGQFFISVNQNLPAYLQALIAWHELGHVILDAQQLKDGTCIGEYDPFHAVSHSETRANYFASEGLIENDAILELIQQGYSAAGVAACLKVPEAFVGYKVQILQEAGIPLFSTETPDAACLQADLTGMENF